MTGQHRLVELIREFRESRNTFTCAIMILMAITTAAGGVIDILHSRAEVEAERLSVLTQSLGARAMAEQVHADQTVQTLFEHLAVIQEQRVRNSNAVQWRLFQRLSDPASDIQASAGESTRLEQLIERSQTLARSVVDGRDGRPDGRRDGPDDDPAFPDRLIAGQLVPYWKVWARQDAANDEFLAWQARQSQYTTILTLYAAALYLFGLALAIHVPVRRMLAWVATGLVVFGTVWAGVAAVHRPWHLPEREVEAYAEDYANAKRILGSAHEPKEYKDAVNLLGAAIGRRPGFAQAYRDRASASFQIGSPQPMGLPGVTDRAGLEAAEADAREALRLGQRTEDTLLGHGFDLFLLALEGDVPKTGARLRASVAETTQALDLNPHNPILYFNRGVAELARLRFAQAHADYVRGVAATIAKDGVTFRFSRSRREEYVAGALTDLQSVLRVSTKLAPSAKRQETLACEVRTLKEYVVGSVSMGKPQSLTDPGRCPPSAPPIPSDFEVYPDSIRWYAQLAAAPSDTDVLSVQWYYRDADQQMWVALPAVSTLATPSVDRSQVRPGFFYDEVKYLTQTVPPSCVQNGDYRAELYLNGRLLNTDSKPASAKFTALRAAMRRDLNLAFCLPEQWKPAGDVSGFGVKYQSRDRLRGMLVLRFHYPQRSLGDADARQRLVADYLRIAVERNLRLRDYGSVPLPADFINLTSMRKYGYREGDTEVAAQAGMTRDGAIVISVVYGPSEYIERGPEASAVFNSLETFGTQGPDY